MEEIDKNAYMQDKNCVVCNCKFGNIGFTITKKYFCKTCFRGVCENCSQNRVNNNRQCDKCFKLNSNTNQDESLNSENHEEAKKENFTEKIKDVDLEIEKIKKGIEESDSELVLIQENFEKNQKDWEIFKDLEKELRLVEEQRTLKAKIYEDLKNTHENDTILTEIESAKSKNAILNEKLASLKNEKLESIDLLNAVLIDLKEKITSHKDFISKLTETIKGPQEPDEVLLQKLNDEKEKNQALQRTLDQIKSEINH